MDPDRAEAPERGGPAGLLWVRQGQAGLHRRDKRENEHAQLARRNLLTSVASEVDAMTGGRRMEVARSQCRAELAQYFTGSGREKKGGPLAAKRQETSSLGERHAELRDVARKLRTALANRRQLQRELDGWLDPAEARSGLPDSRLPKRRMRRRCAMQSSWSGPAKRRKPSAWRRSACANGAMPCSRMSLSLRRQAERTRLQGGPGRLPRISWARRRRG